MNQDPSPNPRQKIEARVTALLLGEITGAEADNLRKAIQQDAELVKLYARLQSTIELVRETSASPAEPVATPAAPLKLSEERRQKLLAHFKTVAPKEFAKQPRRKVKWLVPVSIAACIGLLAAIVTPTLSNSRRGFASLHQEDALSYRAPAPSANSAPAPSDYLGQAQSRPASTPPVFPPPTESQRPVSHVSYAGGGSTIVLPATDGGSDYAALGQDRFQVGNVGLADGSTQGADLSKFKLGDSDWSGDFEAGRQLDSVGRTTTLTLSAANSSFGSDSVGHGAELRPARSVPATAAAKLPTITAGTIVVDAGVLASSPAPGLAANDRFYSETPPGDLRNQFANGSVQSLNRAETTAPSTVNGGTFSLATPTAQGFAAGYNGGTVVLPSASSGVVDNLSVAGGDSLSGSLSDSPQPASHNYNYLVTAETATRSASVATEKPVATKLGVAFFDRPAEDEVRTTNSVNLAFNMVPALGDLPATGRLFRNESKADDGKAKAPGETQIAANNWGGDAMTPESGAEAMNRNDSKFGVPPSGGPDRVNAELQTASPSAAATGESLRRQSDSIAARKSAKGGEQLLESRKRAEAETYLNTGLTPADKSAAIKAAESDQTLLALEKQWDKMGADLKAAQAKVDALRKDLNISDTDPMSTAAYPTITVDAFSLLNSQMPVLEATQARQEAELAKLENASPDKNNPTTPSNSVEVAELRNRVAAGRAAIVQLKRNLENAKKLEAQAEVNRLQKEKAMPDSDPTPAKPAIPLPVPQPEMQTRNNAFSTFSLNVSDVSFKLAAASLQKGVLPEPASIRSEEFINAFDYRDPEPAAGAPVAFAWERARYPFAHNRDLLRFSLKTAASGRPAGRPLNLVLLLDNSGSMERADRVGIIREALRVLAAQLQPQDKLSVVTFARTPQLRVDGVPGSQAGKVAEEVGGFTPEGGTNLEDAMNLAYATALRHYLAGGINRIVLLTDGAANLGNVAPEALKLKVEAHRKQGIAFDCFGIGWEGYNDDLLETLSRNGDGRYGFINTPEEAATGFAGQLAGALQVAASDVKVQVEFNPARVTAYRQIGYAKHQLTKEQFRDNTVDAAEIGAAESGNALYVIEANPAGEGPLATVRVRYKIPDRPGVDNYTNVREQEWTVPFTGNAVALEQSSPAMKLAASSSAFSEWLATSPYAGEVTPDRLLGYLRGVPEVYGADARPKSLEWMIRQAKSLAGK